MIDDIQRQWELLLQAPAILGAIIVAITGMAWGFFKWFYAENLRLKDDLLETYKKKYDVVGKDFAQSIGAPGVSKPEEPSYLPSGPSTSQAVSVSMTIASGTTGTFIDTLPFAPRRILVFRNERLVSAGRGDPILITAPELPRGGVFMASVSPGTDSLYSVEIRVTTNSARDPITLVAQCWP